MGTPLERARIRVSERLVEEKWLRDKGAQLCSEVARRGVKWHAH